MRLWNFFLFLVNTRLYSAICYIEKYVASGCEIYSPVTLA